ncbi:hypothetical protein PGT21_010521 [Puccinia graminis f. sp. tritici]|uniref:Uncharacterized protein n=1 Tax=Puccinia graminis f. sp. tritici TaxID=56615 RepID=A0A5B0M7M9_PUCGR|nr:hypothetical protein PGT21_000768 [Puccinia graminis f. sp. tritici]KAA1074106.1 hypothetical protein PGTUg99_017833 [Puccinia graminis f. sp. tritici]KAA1090678.1 hypothetical protein PGT21_010521 [Puccinia graminis f. sp. tritici]
MRQWRGHSHANAAYSRESGLALSSQEACQSHNMTKELSLTRTDDVIGPNSLAPRIHKLDTVSHLYLLPSWNSG